jgi:hypothetical protein
MPWLRVARTVAIAAPWAVAACGLDAGGLEATARDGGGQTDSATTPDAADDLDAASPDVADLDASLPQDTAPAHDTGPGPDSAVGPVTVTVPATSGIGCPPFFDSGVFVASGTTLKIAASGSWSYRTGYWCGADGSTTPLGSLDGSPYGKLLAQLEGGAAFAVGSSYTSTVNQGGELFFGINNDECTGNLGSLSVAITVTP